MFIRNKLEERDDLLKRFVKVKILFDPNDKDEFVFVSKIVEGAIPKEFIPSIKRAWISGLDLGYPMIRIKATLLMEIS